MEPHDHNYIVHIRSKDCVQLSNGFNTDMQIQLLNAIERIPGHNFHISISSAEIPFTWYNVSSYLKTNQIQIESTAGTNIISIDDGNYDIFDLVTEFSSNVNFPFSITFDEKNYKITLTNTSANTQILKFSLQNSEKMAQILGFEQSDKTVNAGATIISESIVNLRPIHSLFLHSNLASNNVYTSAFGSTENIIDKIPLGEVGPGQIITFDPYETAPFSTIVTVDALQELRLSLRDQNRNLVQLNAINFEISLLISQRLSYDFENDHPNHPYPKINSSRRRNENVETDRRPSPPQENLSNKNMPTSNIKTINLAKPHIDVGKQPKPIPQPVEVSTKRARIDNEHLDQQHMQLQNAMLLASSLPSI